MTPEQLDQIAETVRNNLLNHLDREVDRAMHQLGITDEISDDAWQSLVDLTLARPDRSPSGGAMAGAD